LSKRGSERVAVIINEFGDVGLDHELIEFVEDEVVLMASGCLCCSLRGDLSRTITNLVE
jgi:G3E family GTPase